MRIVVAIAAILVLSSLLLCVSALRNNAKVGERVGFLWLSMTNLSLITGAVGLVAHTMLPLGASATLAISGAHLGILFGYFAVRAGLGEATSFYRYFGFAIPVLIGQAVLAFGLDTIDALLVTSSVLNGILSLYVAWRIWPLAQRFGPEVAALASLPFAAIGAAYLLRLVLLVADASAATITIATLVITFLLAFSALQWAFALIAFRAAQLNKRLEAERVRAEHANMLKSRFLSNMSHELRTPLNGVLGMAQVLQELVRDEEQLRMIDTIRTSGEGLMGILNDILDLSKIEAGKMELENAPFRPVEVLTSIRRLHSPEAEAKGLNFALHWDPALDGVFQGDGHRLTQVLHNLTGNAIKFTQIGKVELRAEVTPGGMRIEVSDTGIGMTEAQLENAFDEFVQADVSITRRFGGTGLGMPIVKHLVTMMGGGVKIKSTAGQGTHVLLDIPLAPAIVTQDKSVIETADLIPDLVGVRVLVAEDNPTNQLVLAAMLRDTGVELTIVGNGREALTAAIAEDFDLFMFDICMPEMDGPTALSQIAAAYRLAGRKLPPAATITANVMPEQMITYAAQGFTTCFPKPMRKKALIDTIQTLTRSAAKPPVVSS
ncbi:ATP-binding protein [Roseicitreum antarcticum]|uniref:ATP-binding protein n=1 Tax=Roseicitreum antarcticum TaxID=564137 RepID=UPI0015A4333F|nr:ATP-binding protein [Roseicitreum antarcticum]